MVAQIVLAIVSLIIVAALFLSSSFFIRALARIPFRWTFNIANTYAIIVSEKNDVDNNVRGGKIVNVLHAIPGKRLVKPDPNNEMGWYFEDGEDPVHQNYLYQKHGIQDMGSIFYKLRTNVDKRERAVRDPDKPEEAITTITKKRETDHVFHTGEMQVSVKGADTADRIPLNFKLNFVFERKYPVLSVLRLADAPAFLTTQVEEIINRETSGRPIDDYYGGPNAKENRKALTDLIDAHLTPGGTDEEKKFSDLIERELGLIITTVAIRDVDVEEQYKAALTAAGEAKKQMEAEKERVRQENENTLSRAEADKTARLRRNDADADRVERVIKPIAGDDRLVAVRFAEALENNDHLTSITYAPGNDKTVLPVGVK